MSSTKLYIKTPLLHSKPLSDLISTKVFVKLENVQLSNSFKIRGFSRACTKRLAENEDCEGFITFSAGNGGLALAYVSNILEKPCHVFMPSFASSRMVYKIREYGAQVHLGGSAKESYEQACIKAEENPKLALIHPHQDPEIWEGYSIMVQEIKEDLAGDLKPSCIVASVGGGGLVTGILKGLEKLGWKDVPVVAMETIGAHCLNKSLEAGKLVENVPMTSIATTLGAPFVTSTLLEMIPEFNVISATLPDERAVDACLKFSEDHMFLVEPAAGVSLATVYSHVLPEILQKKGFELNSESGPVIIIVCGGSDISANILLNHSKSMNIMYQVLN